MNRSCGVGINGIVGVMLRWVLVGYWVFMVKVVEVCVLCWVGW